MTPESREAKARMIADRSDPLVNALLSEFRADPNGRTLSATVNQVLKDAASADGLTAPKGHGIANVVKRAFPAARAARTNSARMWQGFKP